MSTERVLQIPRSDASNAFVIVHVSGQGPPSANLTLLATEDTNPYVSNIRQKQLPSLRAKTYKGDEQEWSAVLSWSLLRQKPSEGVSDFVGDVELVASVHDESEIIITLRHMVSGISQKLGAIVLKRDDAREIDLFAWAGTAAQSGLDAEKAALDLQSRMDAQQRTVDKLNSQLQDLIKSKKQQEDELLEKFWRLLNSKKLKIRDQLRLLSTVKVDPQVANQVRQARTDSKTAPAAKAKSRKRKAQATPSPAEEEDDDEPQMADEETKLGESSDEETFERGASPDRTDSEVTEDDEEPTLPYRNRAKVAADDDDDDDDDDDNNDDNGINTTATTRRAHEVASEAEIELPPRRALPFAKSKHPAQTVTVAEKNEEPSPTRELSHPKTNTQAQPAKPVEDDEETDDEL